MNTGQTRISNRFQLDKDTNRTETLHNAANFNEFLKQYHSYCNVPNRSLNQA